MPDTTYPDMLVAVRQYLGRTEQPSVLAQEADQAAWECFYDRYHAVLTRFARKLGFHSLEIEDLLQDVWCEVIRCLPEFEYEQSRGGFRRWLFVIVRRRAIDHVRRQMVRKGVDMGTASFFNSGIADPRSQDPSSALDRQLKVEVLHAAIERFRVDAPAKEWEAFSLCRLQGHNSTEAARLLSITPEAVRKRLERAGSKLRAALAELVGSEEPL